MKIYSFRLLKTSCDLIRHNDLIFLRAHDVTKVLGYRSPKNAIFRNFPFQIKEISEFGYSFISRTNTSLFIELDGILHIVKKAKCDENLKLTIEQSIMSAVYRLRKKFPITQEEYFENNPIIMIENLYNVIRILEANVAALNEQMTHLTSIHK